MHHDPWPQFIFVFQCIGLLLQMRVATAVENSPVSTAGVDPQLSSLLKKRLLQSEGEHDAHCFIRSPRKDGSRSVEAEAEDEVKTPTRLQSRPSALNTAAADIAAGSPHFSLETPPESPSSQKEASWTGSENVEPEAGEDTQSQRDEDGDAEDNVPYELQFDIMNGLPHNKAVALVSLLKQSRREKVQAAAVADNLQKEVVRLRTQSSVGAADMNAAMETFEEQAEPHDDNHVRAAVTSPEEPRKVLAKVPDPNPSQAPKSSLKPWMIGAAVVVALMGLLAVRFMANQSAASQKRLAAQDDLPLPELPHTMANTDGHGHNDSAVTHIPDSSSALLSDTELAVGQSNDRQPIEIESAASQPDASKMVDDVLVVSQIPPEESQALAKQTADNQPAARRPPPPPPVAATTPALAAAIPYISASLLNAPALQLHHRAMWADPYAAIDVTAEMAAALAPFAYVNKVVRLGRVTMADGAAKGAQAAVTATVALWNDGKVVWPRSTQLRLVIGPHLGLVALPLGAEVFPGSHVALTMQLDLSNFSLQGRGMRRSGWVLECNAEPFGPLLVFDSMLS